MDTAAVLSHCVAGSSPFSKGETLSVFLFSFFCVWVGIPFFAIFLFFGTNYRGQIFVFGVGVGLVFLVVFGLDFCLTVWRFAPEIVRKHFLHVRSSDLGSFVFSGFSSTSFFVFKRFRSGSNRTPPRRTFWSVPFLLFVPPVLAYRPFWPCILSLAVFLGVPFWPLTFSDFPGTYGA